MACILVLSNDYGIREVLQYVLMDMGRTVVVSPLSAQSTPVDHALSPQLILVDLPGSAHYKQEDETILTLRSLYPGANIVALFSGGSDNETRLAQMWGVDDCLFKPFSLDDLLAVIHRWSDPVYEKARG